jgi:hypothetical protein
MSRGGLWRLQAETAGSRHPSCACPTASPRPLGVPEPPPMPMPFCKYSYSCLCIHVYQRVLSSTDLGTCLLVFEGAACKSMLGTWDMGHGTWDMGHGTWVGLKAPCGT